MYYTSKEFAEWANGANQNYVRVGVRQRFLGATGTDYSALSLDEAKAVMRKAHDVLTRRDRDEVYDHGLGKWYRPWDVVPKLKNIEAPEGDFTVGVEVEMGFVSREASSRAAEYLMRKKYVTLDWEGGTYPIEATFPPTLYSKFSDESVTVKYIKFLERNPELVVRHGRGSMVGTHVNVGAPNLYNRTHQGTRVDSVTRVLTNLTSDEKIRYFGRHPYGWGYLQGNGRWIEYKLFNSTTDPEQFKAYVHEAVALTALAASDEEITGRTVRAALEGAYRRVYPDAPALAA